LTKPQFQIKQSMIIVKNARKQFQLETNKVFVFIFPISALKPTLIDNEFRGQAMCLNLTV